MNFGLSTDFSVHL